MRTTHADRAADRSGRPGDPDVPDEPGAPEVEGARPGVPSGLNRLRVLAVAAMGTVLVSYGLTVVIAAAIGVGSGAVITVDGAFALAAPLWLAAHQVPLELDGVALSVLPLLPTAGLVALIAGGSAWAARALGGRNPTDAGPVVATVAGAHGMVAVLVSAVLPPGGAVAAAPWAALLAGALTAGAGAGLGTLRACGPPPAWSRLPGWLRAGLRAAPAGLAGLAGFAAMLLLAGLVISVDEVHAVIAGAGDTAGAVGLTAVSVGYLPNAMVAAGSWMLGSGFAIGAASASPLAVVAAPLPGVPLLAAMPVNHPPTWAWVVFVLPVLVGAAVGWRCRAAGGPVDRLLAVAVACAGMALGVAVAALVVSGRLAAGPFDPVGVPALAAAGAVLVWTLPPAAAVVIPAAALEAITGRRRAHKLGR